ncbi:hypothetical protein OOZ63_03805 [Paucibacter sp. PLA-PC-4]|uniref:hypothetical protein n=1 Tax=Paucibacter sp. PLA-PC-4 TaxID=2993655 RepID=UPI0022489887|nr:hypothetical protein [Paucibacter sp. PLA-PC-4]MCX2860959.1 hypothetical protein [Paucibacter sp. PLA-PC-4]
MTIALGRIAGGSPVRRRGGLLLLIALLTLPLGWRLFGPRGVDVELARKTWRFEIKIEKRVDESGSAWCDDMPSGAREIDRRRLDAPGGGADHCRFMQPQWRSQYTVRSEGDEATPAQWPQPALSNLLPDRLGAQRLGQRQAFFEAHLRAGKGQAWTCRLSQAHWSALALGTKLRLQIDRRGVANCASLAPV